MLVFTLQTPFSHHGRHPLTIAFTLIPPWETACCNCIHPHPTMGDNTLQLHPPLSHQGRHPVTIAFTLIPPGETPRYNCIHPQPTMGDSLLQLYSPLSHAGRHPVAIAFTTLSSWIDFSFGRNDRQNGYLKWEYKKPGISSNAPFRYKKPKTKVKT